MANSQHAPLDSPIFLGSPQAPTPGVNDSSSRLATTAYVKANIPRPVDYPPITLLGDVGGRGTSSITATVLGLRGHPLALDPPGDTAVLQWSEAAWAWRPVPACQIGAQAGGVAGQIQVSDGTGQFVGITISGDATLNTTTGVETVIGLRGRPISPTAPLDGQVLAWSQVNNRWGPATVTGSAGVDAPADGFYYGRQNATWQRVQQAGSYLTANQPISLTGDVTGGPGATTIATTIGVGRVTYAMHQNTTAARLLGNPSLSTPGPLSEISLGTNLSFSGSVLNAAGGGTPGGATDTVQVNAGSGSFRGIVMSGDATWNTANGLLTLANANSGAATVSGISFDQKGRITSATNQSYVTGGPYIPTAGGQISGIAPGSLFINRNSQPLPAAQGNSGLWINFADSAGGTPDTAPNVVLDAHGNNATLAFRMAGGTGLTPTATANGATLGALSWRGYQTVSNAYSPNAVASIIVSALQAFSDSAQGTQMILRTAPIDSTTQADRITIGPGVQVGAPTLGDRGAGTLNAQALYIQGVPVTAGATTLSGDVSGAATATTVIRLQNRNLASTAPLDTQVLGWSSLANQWQPTAMAYLPLAGGTIAGSPGSLTIQRNSTLPPIPSGVVPALRLVGGNGEVSALLIDSFGITTGASTLMVRGARGTAASPSAILHGDAFGAVAMRGYGATQYGSSAAVRLLGLAYEPTLGTWNDGAQGGQLVVMTNPPGTTGIITQAIIGPGLTVGTPTPPLGGIQIGDINGSRILLNGEPITSGGGGGGGPTTLAGDVTGASTATTVVRLQGRPMAATLPLSSQVIGWDGTQWLPVAAVTGSGGPPGGTDGQLQIKAGGAFGGITMSGDATMTPSGVLSLSTPYLPLSGGVISPGTLALNSSGTPIWPDTSGADTRLALAAVTGNPTQLMIDSFVAQSILRLRRANNTAASPQHVALNDVIGSIIYTGFGATSYFPSSGARLQAVATEDWTDVLRGTRFEIATTATGSGALIPRLTVRGLGGVVVGGATGGTLSDGDMGPGTVNVATGLYVNGALVGTGGGSGAVGSGTGPQIAQYPAGPGTTVAGVTLSGDATIAAGGALTIGAGRVTLAKMEARTAATLLGNPTGGSATPVEIPLGSGLAFSAGALTATGGATGIAGLTAGQIPIAGSAITITSSANLSGHVVSAPTTLVTTIQPQVVTHAMMVNVAAQRLIGNPTGSAASRSEISLGTGLSFAGTVLNGAVGTVTSVGLTMPGSIFSVGGSPVAGSGTLAVSVAGTSGGVPYFNTATAMGTSGALTQHGVVLGGGAGAPPITTPVGSTGQVLTGVTGGDPVWQAPAVGGVVSSPLNTVAYYTGTTSVTGHAAMTVTPAGSLIINRNAQPPPAALGNSALWLRWLDSGTDTGPNVLLDTHGNSSTIAWRSTGGTAGTLAATASGATLGALAWRGYQTVSNAYSPNAVASIVVSAAQAFTDTAQGSQIVIQSAQLGTTAQSPQAQFGPMGVLVGTPTGTVAGGMAVGDLNVQGRIMINSVPVGAGADTMTGSITASTTLTQAGATVLASQFNVITTAATTTGPPYAGVALPAGSAGIHCIVRNSGANPISVYPANLSGAQINVMGATVPITVLPNSTAYFEAASATQWFTVP